MTTGSGETSLPIPKTGGPFRASSLGGALVACLVGAAAGATIYYVLEWACSGLGAASGWVVGIAAMIALLTMVPALAGGAAGWTISKVAVATDVVHRGLVIATAVVSMLIATAIVMVARDMELGEGALNSWADYAKITTLLVIGTTVALMVAFAETGVEPMCPTCQRFFRRRTGGNRPAHETEQLLKLARARDLENLRTEFQAKPRTGSPGSVYLELWWCKSCRALGAIEIWGAEETVNTKGESTGTKRRRIHSVLLEGADLAPFL